MYRTFVSLFLYLLRVYDWMASKLPVFKEWEIAILVIGLFALFLLSYKKQTAYISKRVKHNLSKE